MASLPRIGWIGIGVMGRSMVDRLISAGYELRITTRTRDKAASLLRRGAVWADRPADLAATCDVVISMVGYPRDVEAVYLGADGVLAGAGPDAPLKLIIDMTTSSPALAQQLADEAGKRNVKSLDAPVSGGDIGARDGTLSIMVGGDSSAFEDASPIFNHLGKTIRLQGGPGAGQHTKMVNQILIATNMIGVAEGLLYAERANLDITRVIESVGGGAAGSWSINNLGPRMAKGDYAPGFYVEHFIKDMGIALAEAERMQLALPGLALARQLYEAVRAQGHARSGTQAILLALRHLNTAAS
ncbi:MAG: NAD(P)-dependent oxidoreductase [Phycisphaerales bacterium]|nr:NAD(P)-dependent oxidoreductase [Phycisphaerales bacterium]